MGASTIATRSLRRRSKSTLSTTTSAASRNLSVGSVLLSIVANNKLYNKKAQDLLSYAFRSNFLGPLHRSRRPSIFVYNLSTEYHDSPSILLFRICVKITVLSRETLLLLNLKVCYVACHISSLSIQSFFAKIFC